MFRPLHSRLQAMTFLVSLLLAACGSADPRQDELKKGVELMVQIAKSGVLAQAVQNADPQMHATTAAGAALSGGITSNFRLPPATIGMRGPGEEVEPWCVTIRGDDDNHKLIVEGFGEEIFTPLLSEEVDFPRQ